MATSCLAHHGFQLGLPVHDDVQQPSLLLHGAFFQTPNPVVRVALHLL
jgi:hypothetical protein